jgi:hypothetical protein
VPDLGLAKLGLEVRKLVGGLLLVKLNIACFSKMLRKTDPACVLANNNTTTSKPAFVLSRACSACDDVAVGLNR